MDERTQAVPWNHRYLCYCRWHGLPPADMLAFDGARYPGGQMSGFMRWVNGRWNRWCRLNMVNRSVLRAEHHEAFDPWLTRETEHAACCCGNDGTEAP